MMNPLWFAISYLLDQARRRARAARAGDPQSGAITLEWIVIAGILVAAAVAAGVFFVGKIKQYESKIP
jgi:hypothetical protein